eukprot:COSAG01_NODE_9099_length_2556_cov_1.483109_3_plen_59_part_00
MSGWKDQVAAVQGDPKAKPRRRGLFGGRRRAQSAAGDYAGDSNAHTLHPAHLFTPRLP